jgi:putative Holliday junction resolvase
VPRENFLGIDYGKSKIGVAIAPEGLLATGLSVIPNDRNFIPSLQKIVQDSEIKNMVVGLPISMDGRQSASTRAAQEFTAKLRRAFPNQNIFTYDERLTTQEAKRNVPSRTPDDAEAARIILQGFLDKQRKGKNILN